MNTYEKIKALRLEKRMSQDELARLTGYGDRSSIAKIEAGKVDLSESKILLFAKVFGVSPAFLMGIGETEEPEEETVQAGTLLSAGEAELVDCYRSLNPDGQTAALAAVRGLTCLPEYRQDSPPAPRPPDPLPLRLGVTKPGLPPRPLSYLLFFL